MGMVLVTDSAASITSGIFLLPVTWGEMEFKACAPGAVGLLWN
jgi:hypothetical protein